MESLSVRVCVCTREGGGVEEQGADGRLEGVEVEG